MRGTRANYAGHASCLQVYLREIKGESLLTAVEECALAEAIAHGDSDARSRLIRANLRLVVEIGAGLPGEGSRLRGLDRRGQPRTDSRGPRSSTLALVNGSAHTPVTGSNSRLGMR